ncbi:unnamed protein product [Orchesella dallaii]|uniref:Uncharacterized protein n=1 Tax=Orchesella dallaii TaxID=48710 RepID=A0ABP1RSR8_9HEXA
MPINYCTLFSNEEERDGGCDNDGETDEDEVVVNPLLFPKKGCLCPAHREMMVPFARLPELRRALAQLLLVVGLSESPVVCKREPKWNRNLEWDSTTGQVDDFEEFEDVPLAVDNFVE